MQLTYIGLKNQMSSQKANLRKLRQHIQTYSKRKRIILLSVLLIVPLGAAWVLLIIETDKKLKNTLLKNGKGKE